jgi:glycosyltransferase involved in cell wall biosynthesis
VKVLLLIMGQQRVILDQLYKGVEGVIDQCDVYRLTRDQHLNLSIFFREIDFRSYDRVVIFLRLKHLRRQLPVLRCIPNLVFLEHDVCQNYMGMSKYFGAYSRFYRRLPWVRVIVSSPTIAKVLRQEGVDACFASKGYDERPLTNKNGLRDIDIAFLGSLKGDAYSLRREMLCSISACVDLLITRTESGDEYLSMLNRISIFVSADVGMGEYMIKNFEAMACGCALVAWSQGEEEDAALGFEDGRNVMLYRSAEEAVAKIEQLKADPGLRARVAAAGQAFAEQNYTFTRVGRDLARVIEQPLRPWPGLNRWQRLWARLRYGISV